MGINIGGFAAPILCGWVGETYNWHYGFGLAAIGMFIGQITYFYGQKYLMEWEIYRKSHIQIMIILIENLHLLKKIE